MRATVQYLNLAEVAERLGVAYPTLRQARQRAGTDFPCPDGQVGDHGGWLASTVPEIVAWWDARPGRW